jgi:hypothetical protein
MDGKETSQRLSDLCTGNGMTVPLGARVAELVLSRAGPWPVFSSAAKKRLGQASWRG